MSRLNTGRESCHIEFARETSSRNACTAAVACVTLSLFGVAGEANAALVTHWNLNGVDPSVSSVAQANVGTGAIDFLGFGNSAGVLQGTTLGMIEGEIAGDSLSVVGSGSNGKSMGIGFDANGWGDLSISFACRRSTTGFFSNRLEMWDGLGWMLLATFTANATAWEMQTIDLSSFDVLDNSIAQLRVVIDGATSSSGSIRFDNVSVMGTAVPAPAGALALLGLASCVARRRRG